MLLRSLPAPSIEGALLEPLKQSRAAVDCSAATAVSAVSRCSGQTRPVLC